MYMYGDMMHPNEKDDIGLGTEAIGMPPRPPFTCHARVRRASLPQLMAARAFIAGISIISWLHALDMCASLTGSSDTFGDIVGDNGNYALIPSKDTNNAVTLDIKLSTKQECRVG